MQRSGRNGKTRTLCRLLVAFAFLVQHDSKVSTLNIHAMGVECIVGERLDRIWAARPSSIGIFAKTIALNFRRQILFCCCRFLGRASERKRLG